MIVDIWVGIAAVGGVENVISRTASYMMKQGLTVRIIQLIRTPVDWLQADADIYYLMDGPLTSWDGVYGLYRSFYSDHPSPDIVMAEGWPILCILAKKLVVEAGLGFRLFFRMHDSIAKYESDGVGGAEYLQYADVHLALNSAIESFIRQTVPDAVIYRVDNPMDNDRICFSDRRDFHKLVYAGRFSGEKNIPLMLRVVAGLSNDWELVLVGEGPEKDTIDGLIDGLSIRDRVKVLPWSDDPWKLVSESGVLLIASDREVGPLVSIEALAGGMMVLSRPVGNMPDVIMEGENGYLFDTDDDLKCILKDMDSGKLSVPEPDICRMSVNRFLNDDQLRRLTDVLLENTAE